MVWGWACRSAARLSKRTAAACGLLPTPLGGPYFSSFSALRLRHQPLLLDESNDDHSGGIGRIGQPASFSEGVWQLLPREGATLDVCSAKGTWSGLNHTWTNPIAGTAAR